MQSLLKTSGITFLVLSISGLVNIAPAIADMSKQYKGISSSETPVEAPTNLSESIDENTATDPVMDDGMTDETMADSLETDPVETDVMGDDRTITDDMVSEESDSTIVDIAASSETFDTLVSALSETELINVLQSDGPFTVFAPTDAAFDALPDGTVETLMAPENRDVLVALLSYHVIPGEFTTEQLEPGFIDSVQGAPLQVEIGDEVTVNGATVVGDDIPASNGIIHTIDQVILPPQ